MIEGPPSCPVLKTPAIYKLNDRGERFLTKHFKAGYLDSYHEGYFGFGTVLGYKANEAGILGLYGDDREGNATDRFTFDAGDITSFASHAASISNVHVRGNPEHLLRDTQANDFCACLSRGAFKLDRARKVREMNPDVTAYVVYDYQKLITALRAIIAENPKIRDLRLVGRVVNYGVKDFLHLVQSVFKRDVDAAELAVWLRACFMKPDRFSHEEEFRLLLVNPAALGCLVGGAKSFSFEDARIAEAICDPGGVFL